MSSLRYSINVITFTVLQVPVIVPVVMEVSVIIIKSDLVQTHEVAFIQRHVTGHTLTSKHEIGIIIIFIK